MTGAVARGLCADCTYAEAITSSKGSEFVLCRLSYSDPRFPRYPRLPVLACADTRRGHRAAHDFDELHVLRHTP